MSDAIFADPHEPQLPGGFPHNPIHGHSQDAQEEGRDVKGLLGVHVLHHQEHGFDSTDFLNNSTGRENIHFTGHGEYLDAAHGPGLRFQDRGIDKSHIGTSHIPSKLFFASCCSSYHDNQLADHYLNQGAKCFIGYKDMPLSDKAKEFAIEFFTRWTESGTGNPKSAEDAFDESLNFLPTLQGNVIYKQNGNNPIYF